MSYGRHFAALILAAALLASLFDSIVGCYGWDGFWYFGVIGALHSIAWVIGLPLSASWVRKTVFVLTATALSLSVPFCVLGLFRINQSVMFAAGSALGALGYWLLVRGMWLRLRWRSLLQTICACIVATLLALWIGNEPRFESIVPPDLATVLWWLAFSTSVWIADSHAKRSPSLVDNSRR